MRLSPEDNGWLPLFPFAWLGFCVFTGRRRLAMELLGFWTQSAGEPSQKVRSLTVATPVLTCQGRLNSVPGAKHLTGTPQS